MSVEHPLVSVIIPTYNRAAYIVQTIDSVLTQDYPSLEVIVVDDGSTDHTLALLEAKYGEDGRVRVLRQPNNGVIVARNRAIEAARGEYIHFLDSDDYLLPGKIAKSVIAMQSNPQAAVVYSHGTPVQPDGVTRIPMEQPPLPEGDVFCEWITGTMANGVYGVPSAIMVKRAAFEAVGVFRDLHPCEDWDMWIRLAAHYHFVALHESLVIYRRLPDAAHTHKVRMAQGRLRVVQRLTEQPRLRECLSESDYQRLLANRWQVVAQRHWEAGQRVEARAAFAQAITAYPPKALIRRVYRLMTYALPASSTDTLSRLILRLKRR